MRSATASNSFEISEPENISRTVRPADSASENILSRGMVAITSTPVASANLRTISSSPSIPRQLRISPMMRPFPESNLAIPFMMLFAAYSDMNSPEVTRTIPSAYSDLSGTAKPPQTTSPRTS